jgi:hypothetical protein
VIGRRTIRELRFAARFLTATLGRVCDAGVCLTLEEFKGWRPIQRPGLHMVTHAEDFDNPLTPGQYEVRRGGSTSVLRRIVVDLKLLAAGQRILFG